MGSHPSGDKDIQSFLKVALQSMYGTAYSFHFKNPTRSEIMKRFVTSKVISKVTDNASCLLCFK